MFFISGRLKLFHRDIGQKSLVDKVLYLKKKIKNKNYKLLSL